MRYIVLVVASLAVVSPTATAQRPSAEIAAVIEDLVAANRILAAQGVEPQYPLSHALFGWCLRRWRQWIERPVPVDQGADERRTHPIGAHYRSPCRAISATPRAVGMRFREQLSGRSCRASGAAGSAPGPLHHGPHSSSRLTGSRWGRIRAARCLRYRPCRPAMSRSMTR